MTIFLRLLASLWPEDTITNRWKSDRMTRVKTWGDE